MNDLQLYKVKMNERIKLINSIHSYDDAMVLSNSYIKNGDIVNAICILRGWGEKRFLSSEVVNNILNHVYNSISVKDNKKMNTPYKHARYYLGIDKRYVALDLFLSIIYFGNNFSNNYVVTHGVKIPITKAMYNTILTMIDYVKAS